MQTESKLTVVRGDLLMAREQFLVHQCNCVSCRAAGLAAALFARFPEADVYAVRRAGHDLARFGHITVHGRVINLYGQIAPGRAASPDGGGQDTSPRRLSAFKSGLLEIAALPGLRSVAFPFGIGCGLAGGNWPDYFAALRDFAARVPEVRVALYRR
jgi:O-acetyl-ADP-ribose deacetylase (regulator of RNase III)